MDDKELDELERCAKKLDNDAPNILLIDPPALLELVEEVRRLRKAVEEVKGWAVCDYEADGATSDMVLGEIEETCRFALKDTNE